MHPAPERLVIRPYLPGDLDAVLQIFFATVHTVNRRDYTGEQCDAWAPGTPDRERWQRFLAENSVYVAEIEGSVVGFGDLTRDGYLHMLYARVDRQGWGIGSRLLAALETEAQSRGMSVLRTYASITARPFFERRGYRCLEEDTVTLRGVELLRFLMEKKLF